MTVSSIPTLLNALADNSVDEIVVANGTYHVSAASHQASDSLWIGSRYASRTRPITVKAETLGGVTFDGGGTSSYGCMSFEQGAHDQTWDGFKCAGGEATDTGIVVFGGYPGYAAPYRITVNNFTITATCTGNATSAASPDNDHAFYIADAVGGPHDLAFNNITVDGRGGLASAFHFYHSDASDPNGWNINVRGLTVTGTEQAIMLWDSTLHNVTFDTVTVTNALNWAVRYEFGTGVTLANITSTGSGAGHGFYSSLGSSPAGVTFSGDTFH